MPVSPDHDRPDFIGTQDLRSHTSERGNDVGTWVPIQISGAHRNESQRRIHRSQEPVCAARGAAVMANLQDVSMQIVPGMVEQPLFLGGLCVTNEQKSRCTVFDER